MHVMVIQKHCRVYEHMWCVYVCVYACLCVCVFMRGGEKGVVSYLPLPFPEGQLSRTMTCRVLDLLAMKLISDTLCPIGKPT